MHRICVNNFRPMLKKQEGRSNEAKLKQELAQSGAVVEQVRERTVRKSKI